MVKFICYPKCTTCRRAKKWLEDNGVEFDERDIKTNNPTAEELKQWHEKSGVALRKFFNTSGILYREMNLKDKLSEMTEDEQIALLSSDGMLVKRPIVVGSDFVLIGFKEADWSMRLLLKREDK